MDRRARSSATLLLALMASLVLAVAPAIAHHKDGHDNGPGSSSDRSGSDHDGDADSDSNTAYTEDNDTNDGGTPNNVADEGDNAHPSGKDRSVENGGSGNQGKSESNPDDSKGPMRYEGALGDDKPNGPGGTDLADQDGNNGCGNDDDFDDDNNGWCGKPKDTDDDDKVESFDTEKCPDGSMPVAGKCGEAPIPTPIEGKAGMTIHVDCFTVTVTSTKDISNVKVFFVDGTMEEINVNSPSFSKSFSKPIDFATSKSSTTTVIDVASENCAQVSATVCPAGTDMAGQLPSIFGCDIPDDQVCPLGSDMAGLPPSVHGCDISDFKVCPVGSDMAGLPVEKCDVDDVLGSDKDDDVRGSNKDDDVLGGREDEGHGGAGNKGDSVLGSVVAAPDSAGAPGSAGAPAVAGEAEAAPGGALPFTGAGLLSFIAVGLAMIAAGAFVTRKRS